MANIEKKLVKYEEGYLVKKSIKKVPKFLANGAVSWSTLASHTNSTAFYLPVTAAITTSTIRSLTRGANFMRMPKFKFVMRCGAAIINASDPRTARFYYKIEKTYNNPNGTTSTFVSGSGNLLCPTGSTVYTNTQTRTFTPDLGGNRTFAQAMRKNIRIKTTISLHFDAASGGGGGMSAKAYVSGTGRTKINNLTTQYL